MDPVSKKKKQEPPPPPPPSSERVFAGEWFFFILIHFVPKELETPLNKVSLRPAQAAGEMQQRRYNLKRLKELYIGSVAHRKRLGIPFEEASDDDDDQDEYLSEEDNYNRRTKIEVLCEPCCVKYTAPLIHRFELKIRYCAEGETPYNWDATRSEVGWGPVHFGGVKSSEYAIADIFMCLECSAKYNKGW